MVDVMPEAVTRAARWQDRVALVVLFGCAVAWSAATAALHMTAVRRTVPVEERWGETWVVSRADGPAQVAAPTRALSRWAGAGAVRVATALRTDVFGDSLEAAGAARVPSAVAGFAMLRFAQNVLIFSLAGVYYRRLGFSLGAALLAMSLLGWALTQNHWDSHLALSAYTELLLALGVALLLLAGREPWVIPLVVLGALNRETGVLLPVLVLAAGLTRQPHVRCTRRHAAVAGIGFGTYALVSLWLGFRFGQAPFAFPSAHAVAAAVTGNLLRPHLWLQVCAVVGILPLVVLGRGSHVPEFVRRVWWAAAVPWGIVLLCSTGPTQAAFLFVPHALVLVPAVVSALQAPHVPGGSEAA